MQLRRLERLPSRHSDRQASRIYQFAVPQWAKLRRCRRSDGGFPSRGDPRLERPPFTFDRSFGNPLALDALINHGRLEDLVDAPFNWRPGWEYAIPETLGCVDNR